MNLRHRHKGIGSAEPKLFVELRKRFKSGGGSAPPAVDPNALAQFQGNANIATAQKQTELNNVRTTSPLGQSFFEQSPDGRWSLSQALDPSVRPAYNNQANLAATLASLGNNVANLSASPAQGGAYLVDNAINTLGGQIPTGPVSTEGLSPLITNVNAAPGPASIDFSGLTQIPTSASDFSGEVKGAQNAAYDTQAGYLDPQFAQKHSDLAQRLADQGIQAGTDAYSRAQGDLGREETLAYQQAKNAAVAAGNEEQARLYGENLTSRQQGASEAEAQAKHGLDVGNQTFEQEMKNAGLSDAANQAQFGQRVTQWGQPLAALSGAINAGEGALSGASSDLTGLNPLSGFEWAGSLPTYGGSPTAVSPANVVGAAGVGAQNAMNRFTAGNTQSNQLINGIGSLGGALGFGNGGLGSSVNGLFGSGGLFGPAASVGGDYGGGGAAMGVADSVANTLPEAAALWIICTELMRQERMPRRHWIVGAPVFAAYPEVVKRGYYVWAIPSVRHLRRKPDSLYSKILGSVFRWRAENIAASRKVRGARKLWRGAAVTAVLWPLCAAIGMVAGEQDWASVYREGEA